MAAKESADKSKIIMASVAGLIIVLVGAWLLKYYGIIGGDPTPPPIDPRANMTADEQKDFDKMQQDKAELIKRTPPSGS